MPKNVSREVPRKEASNWSKLTRGWGLQEWTDCKAAAEDHDRDYDADKKAVGHSNGLFCHRKNC